MNFTNFNVSNNTFNLTFFHLYIIFGSCALVANFVIVFTLVSNIVLLRKSSFICGLAVGDIIKAIALIIIGVTRTEVTRLNIANVVVSRMYCWKTIGIIVMLGNQIPAVIVLLIGLERFIAVVLFNWYYSNWNDLKAWMSTCFAYCLAFVSVISSGIIIYTSKENITVTKICYQPTVLGPIYSSYNYGLPVVCGTMSILFTLYSLVAFILKRQKIKTGGNNTGNKLKLIRKQLQITITMTCIAFFDFTMVVIPFSIMIMTSFFGDLINVGYISSCLISTRATFSFIIYFVLNQGFRETFLYCVTFKKTKRPRLTSERKTSTL